ncbi:MAG: tetratricopeptide repeat protein [Chitinophagaceae bacterium]|nr:tetratricopeptide repeat protein [Chitinophagaceae bacterium]
MLKILLPGCLVLLLLIAAHVNSQPDTSRSLILAKARLAFEMAAQNADSSQLLAQEALASSLRDTFDEGVANSYNSLGWMYLHRGRYDSSIFYLQLAKQTFVNMRSDRDLARVGINLSQAYTRQSHFSSGIETLLEAEAAANRIKDEGLLTDIKRNLGIIYRETGDTQKAIAYLREAMNGFSRLNDDNRYVHTALSLAIVYNNQSKFDSARSILENCLAISSQIPNSEYQVGMIHEHLGETWKGLNNHDRRLEQYMIAYSIFKKIGNIVDIAYESINIGRALIQLKSFDKAEKYLLDAYRLTDSLALTNYHQEALQELANLYRAKGDLNNAYNYLEKSSELKDSLTIASNLAQTTELKERYESAKKEQEITLLKKDNELNLLALQRQKTIQLAIAIGTLLLLVIGGLAINRYRVVQKSKRIIELEKMRNQIASDLHDDIGSTLTSMNILSKMMTHEANDNVYLYQNLQRISEHSSAIMDSMGDIVWAIHPANDSLEKVIYRMKEFAAELLEPLNINYTFELDGEFSTIQLDPRKRKNLYLIFKEAINNAAKYSQCTGITVTLQHDKRKIRLTVSDNGTGFHPSSSNGGNGLRNMRGRATEMQGEISIESTVGNGTMVQFQMSYPDQGIALLKK